jgi:uncharacterized protein (DUF2336 family)
VSDLSFFSFLQSPDPRQRSLAVLVMGRAFLAGELDDYAYKSLVRGLTAILDDTDVSVRRALAEVMADADNPPRHIVHGLCRDHFDVARPLIEKSSAISDHDLVDLVGEGTEIVRRTIAARADLRSAVAAAVAEVGERDTCLVLIENGGAMIADISFVRLAKRFGADSELRAALLARHDTPLDVRHGLLAMLSDALGSLIVGREWIGPERARLVIREACEKATIEFTEAADDEEQRALVAHLSVSGRLTPGLLMRALSIGNLQIVAEALALLSGLPVKRVLRLLHDRRAATMFALLANAGLPKAVHHGFLLSVRTVIECQKEGFDFTSKSDRLRLVERILTRYQNFAPEDLSYMFGLLTRLSGEAARAEAREMFGMNELEGYIRAA